MTNKRPTISKLKKKLWKLFSEYIRKKYATSDGYVHCCTCSEVKHYKEMQAGHFKHGNTRRTYFDERNVHPQCVRCNMYLSGNLTKYAIFLERKYGYGILQELETLSNQFYKYDEIEEMIKCFGSQQTN